MTIEHIALAGGLYVPLVFWHFIADWLTQTEKMAEAKSKNPVILFLHCATYTILFMPFFWLYDLGPLSVLASSFILLVSHIVGDTYYPVFWWAKFIRRMTYAKVRFASDNVVTQRVMVPEDIFRDGQFINTSFYFKPTLVIVIDQLWHLAFLWVIPILAILGKGGL